jgi:hypothetical protein
MSDLVLGLLLLGALLFGAVLVYNRVQERAAQRAAERAFGSSHTDTLMERIPSAASPDERVDYVIEIKGARPIPAALVHEGWRPIEQRFGRRVLLAAPDSGGWRAALQLVNRSGAVSEAELVEFRSQIYSLAARLGATVAAPEVRQALEAARELDRTCTDTDIQVALHVLADNLDPDLGKQPFQVVRREDGLTLVLDVAVTPDLGRSYEAMARAGRDLAAAHGGRLVDDRGNALDDRALAAIGAQLEAVRQMLAVRGIETGSALALRLFS